jgi:hypothetical protein
MSVNIFNGKALTLRVICLPMQKYLFVTFEQNYKVKYLKFK